MKKRALTLLALMLAPACAFAVDGVVLINQSTVMAAGGFPYNITQSGSYKLAGNLVVTSVADGIHISASNVTLDLNGFTISGQQAATFPAPIGIVSTAGTTCIAIRNGIISGFGTGVDLSNTSRVSGEDLLINNETKLGFFTSASFFGSNGVVRRVVADIGIPGFPSIVVTCPMVVVQSVALSSGFLADDSSSPACTFSENSGPVVFAP